MQRSFVNCFYSGEIHEACMYKARVWKVMCNYKNDAGSLRHSVSIKRYVVSAYLITETTEHMMNLARRWV
jgi:hypothetical protein